MRRVVVALAALMLVVGLAGIQPASATHGCANPDCNPVTVAVLEGIGKVCELAFPTDPCTYQNDAFWPLGGPPLGQGLYWPRFGPPALGKFVFNAGPGSTPPTSLCVSSVAGAGCTFLSNGSLFPGEPVNGVKTYGVYCGSSHGTGVSIFTSGAGLTVNATFGWRQSAATILPLEGKVTSSTPPGGAGATVIGFTSSRGTGDGANCGISKVTTQFNVEGMVVTF